jgi:phosphoenolpyruvate synthase/pyruvate phosphate dikinase
MSYVLEFHQIAQDQVAVVGGKGAQLGELSRIDGVRVPDGFCVTTQAFRRFIAQAPSIEGWLGRLARLSPTDRAAIGELSMKIRTTLEAAAVPADLETAITRALERLGQGAACAVRSSATAEDLPTASFAGQQDSYLNVVGAAAILEHVRRCWASLFTERAVAYRLHSGFDQRAVQMGVVVQRMVFAQASGVLFTADPVTSNRKVASVEACVGLGEALVSGLANADVYEVTDGEIIRTQVATKHSARGASPAGGTREEPIAAERQHQPALTEAQVVRLVRLGRRIEAHFGRPQDIEWCLTDDEFQIVQSRAITTLFPIPAAGDGENHVYVSVGHQQMMTDAFRPLGLSVWQLTTPRPMTEAGGRLFADVTAALASPAGRGVVEVLGSSDPLIGDALQTILDRGDFIRPLPGQAPGPGPQDASIEPVETDPAIVAELIEGWRTSITAMTQAIGTTSGPEVFDFIANDIRELKRLLFSPRSMQVIMAGMDAARWLNENLQEWLGERNPADTLAQSAPHNVTAEMGLALLDVADAIRPYPEVLTFLHDAAGDGFLDDLAALPGGTRARDAICAYLDRYGMRCVGEIDITRPRWSEQPSTLLPAILANVENFEPGAGRRRFEQGRQNAAQKEREILSRLRALPGGGDRAREAKRMIDRLRTFAGYREYPKYGLVSRYFVYKQAVLRAAGRLVEAGVLPEPEDSFFLTFPELHDAARTDQVDGELIDRRKREFGRNQALRPPRVMTSDGEVITGSYRRGDLPAGALAGLPVSAGTVEGRARVVTDIARADLVPDDILVTICTDPSWTPLFLTVKGLVTEVGGLMTHGAVIAREYGLPAVVGVQNATGLIRDGQRIRLNGTAGYIELLSDPAPPVRGQRRAGDPAGQPASAPGKA